MPKPIPGTVCNSNAKLSFGKICTKSSFSRSVDIVGGTKNLNKLRDYNHTPFGGDFLLFW